MDLLSQLLIRNNITKDKTCSLSPLVLAFIGDAIFELYIRVFLVGTGEVKVGTLHKKSILYVKAKAQAELVRRLSSQLTEEESDIVRRGRNIKPASPPKNADVMDYRYATGFEALVGHLFLTNNHERLLEILELSVRKE